MNFVTRTGLGLDLLTVTADDIRIEDIAASLSKQCRFAGHCRRFYTVAEHSILVGSNVPPEFQLEALLHDAAEAYVVDVPHPLKSCLQPVYGEIEAKVQNAIRDRFGLPRKPLSTVVKLADLRALRTEFAQLFEDLQCPNELRGVQIFSTRQLGFLSPSDAEQMFLRAFHNLTNRN